MILNNTNKKFNIQDLFIDNYFGKSIGKIIKWYPQLISTRILFQYLIQSEQYDKIVSILTYEKIVQSKQGVTIDNDDAYFGFLDLMTTLEELVLRQMILFYYGEEWLASSYRITKLRQHAINYQEFISFFNQTRKLHYITPSEYNKYVHERLNNADKRLDTTLNVTKWYYDYSLYYTIGQDKRYSDVEKYKKILTPYDAQFAAIFLKSLLPRFRQAKLYTKHFIYEKLFITIITA